MTPFQETTCKLGSHAFMTSDRAPGSRRGDRVDDKNTEHGDAGEMSRRCPNFRLLANTLPDIVFIVDQR